MSDVIECPFCQGAQRVHDPLLGGMVTCYGCNGTGVIAAPAPVAEGLARSALVRIAALALEAPAGQAIEALGRIMVEAENTLLEIDRMRGG